MDQLLAGIGVLLSAMFGTQQYQRWHDRRNGNDGPTRVVKAIKEEGRQTRASLERHNDLTTEAMKMFQVYLAEMRRDCAVSHATLSERIEKP